MVETADAVELIFTEGPATAMNRVNSGRGPGTLWLRLRLLRRNEAQVPSQEIAELLTLPQSVDERLTELGG